MKSFYEFIVNDDTDICHVNGATEIAAGMSASIFRKYKNDYPDYATHKEIVRRLLDGREHADIVFLQTCPPAMHFLPYEKEPCKLPITLTAYIRLLDFSKNQLPTLMRKIALDSANMREGQDWARHSDTIMVRKSYSMAYKQLLDSGKHHELFLYVVGTEDNTKMAIVYSDTAMGEIALTHETCTKMAKDLETLKVVLNYIDPQQNSNGHQLKSDCPNDRNRTCSGQGAPISGPTRPDTTTPARPKKDVCKK